MLTRNEPGASASMRTEKGTGTKVAVLNPEVVRLHRLQDLAEQRAFLRMAIFTGKDITDHAVGGLIDDEGFPGQRASLHLAQHFKAVAHWLRYSSHRKFSPDTPATTRTVSRPTG